MQIFIWIITAFILLHNNISFHVPLSVFSWNTAGMFYTNKYHLLNKNYTKMTKLGKDFLSYIKTIREHPSIIVLNF